MTSARRSIPGLSAALFAALGLVLWLAGGPVGPAAGQTDTFEGDECTTTATGDGVCVIDEPEGQNPDTYGTVAYDRSTGATDDDITFTIKLEDPDGTDPPELTELQICMQPAGEGEDNPYTPGRANSCAGNQPDRVFVDEQPPIENPVTIDLTEALADGFSVGDRIWFALHMVIDDDGESRTVMVTGPVASGAAAPVTYALTVSKDVQGGQNGEEFGFRVDCRDYTLSSTNNDSADVSYDDGDARFTLADGENEAFTGLPEGATCTVGEEDPGDGWETTVNGEADDDATVDVTLDGDRTVAFTNSPAVGAGGQPITRGLIVTKAVEAGDDAGRFTFTVDCDVALGPANNDTAAVTYDDGDARFTLADGGSMSFSGIDDGSMCTVAETVPDGVWSTRIDGRDDPDRSARVTLDADRRVAFVNIATDVAGEQEEQRQPAGPDGEAAGQPGETGETRPPTGGGPPTDVAGAQEQRDSELPRTGSVSPMLVVAAGALIASGTALRTGARRFRRDRRPAGQP